jgi:diguanylate cyclase (GGDEF)-like protein
VPRTLSYSQAKVVLALLGMGITAVTTLLAYERGAPPTEVIAPALYLPIVLGAVFLGLVGGLVAAALASLIYGVLLVDEVWEVRGFAEFSLLLTNRVLFYFFLAVILAVGIRFIEARLHKLEIYDQVDDLTGLYNSAFFLQNTDLETSRANRYQSVFSVVDLEVAHEAFADLPARRTKRLVKDLASRIQAAVRQVDRPARASSAEREYFLIILPETGQEGAHIFAERLEVASRQFLAERGCRTDGHVSVATATYPEQPDDLSRIRDQIAALETQRRTVSDQAGA